MKNFNKMSRGEQLYAMNEVISALNEGEIYDYRWNWNKIYLDGELFILDNETIEDAKEEFDECSDECWNHLVQIFKDIVDAYGCEYGRSIQKEDVDGLYVPCIKHNEYIEDKRGGGFYFKFSKKNEPEVVAKVARVRETLTAFGYPLTENNFIDFKTICIHSVEFYVDWKKWRAQKAASFIKESIKSLLSQECGCCTIRLTAATQLAVGWKSGFDPKDPSVIHSMSDPTECLCAGIKAIEGSDAKADFEQLITPYAANGANKGETFLDLDVPLELEEDREKDFEYLIGKYQRLLKKYEIQKDGECFHKEPW